MLSTQQLFFYHIWIETQSDKHTQNNLYTILSASSKQAVEMINLKAYWFDVINYGNVLKSQTFAIN